MGLLVQWEKSKRREKSKPVNVDKKGSIQKDLSYFLDLK